MKNTLLIFGYGYTGSYVANLLRRNDWQVIGTSRTLEPNLGVIPYEKEAIEEALKVATHILISIPPNHTGDVVLNDFSDLFLNVENLKWPELKWPELKWIGYLSTTGVYGNHDGLLVDEKSELKPSNDRALIRILAEKQWLEFGKKHNIIVNIFRLAGIYGPERNAIIQVKSGQAKSIFKEGQVFSRIHVEDIAGIISAAIQMEDRNEQIYNLADDHPCSTIEVNNYAAQLLGLETPPIIDIKDAQMSEMAKEFYRDNKRVSNAKIKGLLYYRLKYPTYREGLLAMALLTKSL